jgi:HK97 family phage prohead protease
MSTYDAAMERLDRVLEGTGLSATGAAAAEPKVKEMILAKATVVAAEAGTFSAIISTEKPDRENDIVLPEAVADALQAWGDKPIPLAWQHRADDPDEIIGHIVANSVKAIDGEVHADGWVDRDTPRGKQVWRLIKSGVVGFSYGYLVLDSVKRADGARELRKVDIFEISVTATPMNGGTRVTDWKSTEQPEPEVPEPEVPTPEELRARSDALERELGLEDPAITEARTRMRDLVLRALRGSNGEVPDGEKRLTPDELRRKSDAYAKEFAPITVATFDC